MKLGSLHRVLLYAAVARASLSYGNSPKRNLNAQVFEREVTQENDPVRFSVLSVLHTAIPSDALSIMAASPTAFSDANPPDWYKNLPGDVKSLLPILYPKKEAGTTTSTCSETAPATSTPTPVAETNSTPDATPVDYVSSSIGYGTGYGGYVYSGSGVSTGEGSATFTSVPPPYANSTIAPLESPTNATSTITLTSPAGTESAASSSGPGVPEQTTSESSVVGMNLWSVAVMAAVTAWICLLG